MLTSAFGWIGEIARFLGSLLPRPLIVKASHRAVKYVRGRRIVELAPGWHIYWPFTTEYESCAVVRQVLNLPTQLLETRDGDPVAVGGVVEYEIVDAIRFLAHCEDGYAAIENVATAAIRGVVNAASMQELRATSADLDRALTRATQRFLTAYGVKVKRTRLSDCARVQPLHLTGGNIATINFERAS